MALNVVVVLRVPVFVPVLAQALVPSVAASVLTPAPPPPAIEPLKVVMPAASVNTSLLVPPTRALIEVAFMPSRLTALAPVMLQALTTLRPVKVSIPVPPVKVPIAENVVVVPTVPALAPVLVHALAPFVAASVFAPPPPAIEPLNVVIPAANVKTSLLVPPTSASITVAFMLSTLTALAPVNDHAVAAFRPVKVSTPEPPVRFVIAENTVLVLKVPAFAPVIAQAFAPLVAARLSVPPPPAIVPLKVIPAACVKPSVEVPPTRLLI